MGVSGALAASSCRTAKYPLRLTLPEIRDVPESWTFLGQLRFAVHYTELAGAWQEWPSP